MVALLMKAQNTSRRYALRFAVAVLLLLLPVPWFAPGWLDGQVLGLPVWLIYSVAGTGLFTLGTALLLEYAWDDD
jgi:hypothetical protein